MLAGELAEARGDSLRAFAAYEQEMVEPVRRSRAFARGAAKTLVPNSPAAIWAITRGAPTGFATARIAHQGSRKLNTKGVRMHDSMQVRDYTMAVEG